MEPYQQRVIDEKKDMDGKIERLLAFINGPKFTELSEDEQDLLLTQRDCMQEYSGILGERIANFSC